MTTWRMRIDHRLGHSFTFECEADDRERALELGEALHPGSTVGPPWPLISGGEHSASRRADVLERDAPHLIAPIEPHDV